MTTTYRLGRLTSNSVRDSLILILRDLNGDPRVASHPDHAVVQQVLAQLSDLHAANMKPPVTGGAAGASDAVDAAAGATVAVSRPLNAADMCNTVDLSARVGQRFGPAQGTYSSDKRIAFYGMFI